MIGRRTASRCRSNAQPRTRTTTSPASCPDRPGAGDPRRRVRRRRRARRPGPEQAKTRENDAGEEPEPETAAQRPGRRRDRDAVAAAEGVEIDDGDRERHEQRDQEELDRPAAHDPAAEPDVAARARGEGETEVERSEQLLGCGAELSEPGAIEVSRDVAEGLAWAVAPGRERDRRDVGGDERPLFVEREREGEIDQLSEEADVVRPAARLLGDAGDGGGDERRVRRTGRVAGDLDGRPCRAGDGVEVDDRDDVLSIRRVRDEVGGAESTVGAAVGREEDDRACRRDRRRGCLGVGASELDQRRGAARVVVGAGPAAEVVAVSHDDDHLGGRLSGRDRDDVLEPHLAEARDALHPRGRARPQPVHLGRQLVEEPARGADRPGAPGRPVRVGVREVGRERVGRGRIERAGQRRSRERRRRRHGERQQQQRDDGEQERGAVEPAVDRTGERTAAWPPAPPGGERWRGHRGL